MTTLDLRAEARRLRPDLPHMPALRYAAIATWRARMVNEHGSARVFDAIARQLATAGFDAATVRACEAFAGEERTHGALCGAVVDALGGEPVAKALPYEDVPMHADVAPLEAVLRNLLSVSCLR